MTEHADDSPTGKIMVAVIESMDEFYSENLARNVPPIYHPRPPGEPCCEMPKGIYTWLLGTPWPLV